MIGVVSIVPDCRSDSPGRAQRRMVQSVASTDTRVFFGTIAVAASADIQIGELSRRSGCNIETIRYYERIALLPRPARSARRYRLYGAADVRRLAFIRRARELGFALDAVRALLDLLSRRPRRAARAGGKSSSTGPGENRQPAGHGAHPGGSRAVLRSG